MGKGGRRISKGQQRRGGDGSGGQRDAAFGLKMEEAKGKGMWGLWKLGKARDVSS